MSDNPGKCLECGSPTHPILVLEAAHGNRHQLLEYAAKDAKAGWFFGRYPTQGHLAAELCESCGRVALRAVPTQ